MTKPWKSDTPMARNSTSCCNKLCAPTSDTLRLAASASDEYEDLRTEALDSLATFYRQAVDEKKLLICGLSSGLAADTKAAHWVHSSFAHQAC